MLIVLEGIDGSGKSTVAQLLAKVLEKDGKDVVLTREPWTSPAGQKLRELLARPERHTSPEEELALFHEDRKQHVAEVVRPALERGAWVIQDRTFYSTAAYQGAVGLDVKRILAESRKIAPEPDLVFLLCISPRKALERIDQGRDAVSNFEELENLRKVDQIYRRIARGMFSFQPVDAEAPLEEVLATVVAYTRGLEAAS